MLIAVNRGRGSRQRYPLTPLVPSPCSALEESDKDTSHASILLSLGRICLSGGRKGEGTKGQGALSTALYDPKFGRNITKATKPPGTCGTPV